MLLLSIIVHLWRITYWKNIDYLQIDGHVYSLGYMSQDSVNLAVLEATGDEKEKARAGKVLGLLKKGQHWVLGASHIANLDLETCSVRPRPF